MLEERESFLGGKRAAASGPAGMARAWPQRRKLFLLALIWAGLCLLLLFHTPHLPGMGQQQRPLDVRLEAHAQAQASDELAADHVAGKRAASSLRPLARVSSPSSAPTLVVAQPNVIEATSEQHVISSAAAAAEATAATVDSKRLLASVELADSEARKRAHSQLAHECAYEPPTLADLQFNNIYWQKFTTRHAPPANVTRAQATYYLYNAYYDDRWRANGASVRLLAMIDRVQPPATNCLLWSNSLRSEQGKLQPLVTRAQFVYAWYPKWGNYEDGLLQPWIVSCPVPREHARLVPDSVSLVEVPLSLNALDERRKRRSAPLSSVSSASIAMPPAYSSSSSSSLSSSSSSSSSPSSSSSSNPDEEGNETSGLNGESTRAMDELQVDCKSALPITNNLPVVNKRPAVREQFAVCVKGLDFPYDDVSVRLVEWLEMLSLLGAKKVFLYQLQVHANVSRVLAHYQARGLVELSPLTLPGEQPNLPQFQHAYLKQRLTAKRQNELIPYNDCLYRNLYSYKYLALLDIDELIMPLQQATWPELMAEVERLSLAEQNYSRASYNVRNVYFFDDLSGPLGTTQASPREISGQLDDDYQETGELNVASRQQSGESAERGIPHYLHMMSHVYRSKNYTEPGQYVKCFHNTERVVSLHNHFPMNCFGQCTTYSIQVELAHLQHYRKDCVGPLRQSCKNDFRHFTTRDTTIWRYKQRMIKRTTRVLTQLGLIARTQNSIQ